MRISGQTEVKFRTPLLENRESQARVQQLDGWAVARGSVLEGFAGGGRNHQSLQTRQLLLLIYVLLLSYWKQQLLVQGSLRVSKY